MAKKLKFKVIFEPRIITNGEWIWDHDTHVESHVVQVKNNVINTVTVAAICHWIFHLLIYCEAMCGHLHLGTEIRSMYAQFEKWFHAVYMCWKNVYALYPLAGTSLGVTYLQLFVA